MRVRGWLVFQTIECLPYENVGAYQERRCYGFVLVSETQF